MFDNPQAIADYSNENIDKTLDIYSLIEAIHEVFDATSDHDYEYLNKRISLLREFFDIEEGSLNEHAPAVDQLIFGYGKLPSIDLLPFEGAIEVPNSLNMAVQFEISEQFAAEIARVREAAFRIRRAYITHLVLQAVDKGLHSRSITLRELIARGLPESDLGTDINDY